MSGTQNDEQSGTFDDENIDHLYVFSGHDLLLAHYGHSDLDWQEIAERTEIDERRGLLVCQVAVIEDLIDEFILYLKDPEDAEAFRLHKLARLTIGPRIDMLQDLLETNGLATDKALAHLTDARNIVQRRNTLAHGTIFRHHQLPSASAATSIAGTSQWMLLDRRSGRTEPISMSDLRESVYEAIGVFTALLSFAELFVETAPWPKHFRGGHYLGTPTS